MARLPPLWAQTGSYSAVGMRGLVGAIWPAGGMAGMAATIQATSMNVQVAPGTAVVVDNANPGAAWLCQSTATETVGPIPTVTGGDRIDLITVQPQDVNAQWIYNVVAGTVSASPAPPAVPAGQLAVCEVRVSNGSPTLTAPLVDRRPGPLAGPLGRVAHVIGPAGAYVEGDPNGADVVTLAWRTVPGRYYRISVYCASYNRGPAAGTNQTQHLVHQGATYTIAESVNVPVNTWMAGTAMLIVPPGPATNMVDTIRVFGTGGWQRVNQNNAHIAVEDIGPA